MHRIFLAAVVGLVMATRGVAEAGEAARVVVVRTGGEPACLDPAAVASAITRHAATPAQAMAEPPTQGEGVVEIRITGDARQLRVQLTGGGHDRTTSFDDTPCPSMPDVVAAFVASALAPTPDLSVVAPPAQVDAAATAAAHLHGERLAVLATALRSNAAPTKDWKGREYLFGAALGIGMGALTIATADEPFGTTHVLAIGGAVVTTAGGITAYATWGHAHARLIGEATFALGFGTILAANAFDGVAIDDQNIEVQRDTFHEADLVFAGTVVVSGLWRAIDYDRLRPTSDQTLERIRRRIKTPQQRAQLSAAELASYEQAYLQSRLPKWRYLIPLVAGSAASFLMSGYETNEAESRHGLYGGIVLAGIATLVAIIPDPVATYRSRLRNLGLDVEVAPIASGAAVSMRGRF